MEPKQHYFNIYSKVVYIIFQLVLGDLVCMYMLVALIYFYLALCLHCALQHLVK